MLANEMISAPYAEGPAHVTQENDEIIVDDEDDIWDLIDLLDASDDEAESSPGEIVFDEDIDEANLGPLDRIPRVFAEVLATDGRLPAGSAFSLTIRDKGYGVDDTGLEMNFPVLEDEGNKELWPLLDLIEARAVRIMLAISPDLFGFIREPINMPENSRFGMDETIQIDLSAHERMARVEALRDRLAEAGKNPEEIAVLLATPRPAPSA